MPARHRRDNLEDMTRTPPHRATDPHRVASRGTAPGATARSLFLRTALRRPGLVGAVAPSSRVLATQLAAVVPDHGTPTVLELGAGSGAVSAAVLARLPRRGHHLAVDADPGFAEHLRNTLPRSEVIEADAADLARHVAGPVDAVISALPFSLIPGDRRRAILDAVAALLDADGALATVSYRHTAPLPGTRGLLRALDERFDEVIAGATVWPNLPPARVLYCRRPRRGGPR